MDDPLRIGRHAEVPLSEIELRTSRSSGPGGQHANVTASRVEAVFDVCSSQALSEEQRERIAARLGPVVRAVAQDTRSQARNRELALERLRGRLESALTVQRPAARHQAARTRRGAGARSRSAAAASSSGCGADPSSREPAPRRRRPRPRAGPALVRRAPGRRRRRRPAAEPGQVWRCSRRCRPPAAWSAPPAWRCDSVSVWLVVVRSAVEGSSNVGVPPTPRSAGLLFGSGSLPPGAHDEHDQQEKDDPSGPGRDESPAPVDLLGLPARRASRPTRRPAARGRRCGRSPAAPENPCGLILH